MLFWLAFGPFAIYSPIGFIDPWLYTGYFTNFRYLLVHHGFTYYISRLPWIIPGRIAFSILSPMLGSLLLCAGLVTVSALSLYWAVRWYYGRLPAILAGLALVTNAWFMAAVGWQYPDGPAICYGFLALALYLRPHGSPGWNGFLAAAALTFSACTNLAAAPMLVSLLAIPLWRGRHSARELGRQGLWLLAGVAVTTLMLTLVSKGVLGDARIFKPQFDMWLYTTQHPAYLTEMWGSGPGFLPSAVRLFTPAFLLAFGLVLLIAVRKPAAAAWPSYLALLICCLLYAFQQFVLDKPLLRVVYHSSYMMVVVACFAGVVLGELWKRGGFGTFAALTLGALTVAIPFLCRLQRQIVNFPSFVWLILASIGAVATVLGFIARWRSPPVQYITLALVLIAISVGPGMDTSVIALQEGPLGGTNLSDGPRAVAFRCLMNLQDFLKSNLDTQREVAFWWDDDEPLSKLYTSGAAMWASRNLELTKQLAASSQRLYPENATFVHLTSYPQRLSERRRLLATRGLGVTNDRRIEISYGAQHFTILMQDLTALDGLP